LTTDFGEQDAYVAAMKGVLLSGAPDANILDLSHTIPPQDVIAGAMFLAEALPWFPVGTIHVVVVDPGVGSRRNPIAVLAGEQYVVLPDNGLLTLVQDHLPIKEARLLENPKARMPVVSATFHGRDIFTPAAAWLADERPFAQLGPVLETLETLDLPDPSAIDGGWKGELLCIDRFGNCLTNIVPDRQLDGEQWQVTFDNHHPLPLSRTYADAEPGYPVALLSSGGRLEIAVRNGSAAESFGLRRGTVISLTKV
jgi:hypothetical protein